MSTPIIALFLLGSVFFLGVQDFWAALRRERFPQPWTHLPDRILSDLRRNHRYPGREGGLVMGFWGCLVPGVLAWGTALLLLTGYQPVANAFWIGLVGGITVLVSVAFLIYAVAGSVLTVMAVLLLGIGALPRMQARVLRWQEAVEARRKKKRRPKPKRKNEWRAPG